VPGTVLKARYRIVGPIGRGGMGEVFRADDLRLGQAVALKFLPESLENDADRLERLYTEVRLAREITSAAICRVHDVDDVDGLHFISMEYIDGEDLGSLLRRIGRLPGDKALELARQLCAGLAAAHDKGVLHRDLKPQNVMLDGRGRGRITDFGLATIAGDLNADEVRSGTPAYMAPEQLEGREVTVRSDVYALGLVLYEIFTGRRAIEGRTLEELTRRHREQVPVPPSTLVSDVDPAVDGAILRCLEKDPARRPASALAVAALLPGGDPLAAALAAGETPSPELVAASGRREGLSPRQVWVCAAIVGAAVVASVGLSAHTDVTQMVPLEKAPAVLEDRARAVLTRFGYSDTFADRLSGFSVDRSFLHHSAAQDHSARRFDALRLGRPSAVQYWYRQARNLLVPWNVTESAGWDDPPWTSPGMIGVKLDTQGRLYQFYAIQSRLEADTDTPAAPPDWKPVFEEAQLDPALFTAVPPRRLPIFQSDARAAWEGAYPERPDLKIKLEAAAYRGRVVSVQIVGPWSPTAPTPMAASRQSGRWIGLAMGLLVAALAVGIPAHLARAHVRSGKGDRAGARRLGVWMLATSLLGWALGAHHVADRAELSLAMGAGGIELLRAAYIALLYLALEPYVRRRWPSTIVSWMRLVGGSPQDPLVGRDVLIGIAWGAATAGLTSVVAAAVRRLGLPAPFPKVVSLDALLGWPETVSTIASFQTAAVGWGMGLLLVAALVRGTGSRTKRGLFAALATAVMGIGSPMMIQHAERPGVGMALTGIIAFTLVTVLARVGLLAAIVGCYVGSLFDLPLSTRLDDWSGGPTLFLVVFVSALTIWSGRTALAGRPLLPSTGD
jgi:tRNA A-37 threonylcarbamoyl transferase component Bud32